MNIEIRIYKRYDTDLLSLHDAGYSISKMMTEAVSAYANGLPCYFFIDEFVPFDMNDKKSVRLRLKIKESDYNTKALIRNVKHGYRSNFCKQILRNAFIQQNLVCYLSDNSMIPIHNTNAQYLNKTFYQNLHYCSEYRRMVQKIDIMGQSITIKHKKGFDYNPQQPELSQNVFAATDNHKNSQRHSGNRNKKEDRNSYLQNTAQQNIPHNYTPYGAPQYSYPPNISSMQPPFPGYPIYQLPQQTIPDAANYVPYVNMQQPAMNPNAYYQQQAGPTMRVPAFAHSSNQDVSTEPNTEESQLTESLTEQLLSDESMAADYNATASVPEANESLVEITNSTHTESKQPKDLDLGEDLAPSITEPDSSPGLATDKELLNIFMNL